LERISAGERKDSSISVRKSGKRHGYNTDPAPLGGDSSKVPQPDGITMSDPAPLAPRITSTTLKGSSIIEPPALIERIQTTGPSAEANVPNWNVGNSQGGQRFLILLRQLAPRM
jgi:hypothetical protein